MRTVTMLAPPGLEDAAKAAQAQPGPAWLVASRKAAWATFEAKGMPTTRDEAWKYTDLAPIARTSWRTPPASKVEARDLPKLDIPGTRIVFVNGRVQPPGTLPKGVTVESSTRASKDPFPEGQAALPALNAALHSEGVTVRVADGIVLADPLLLLHVTDARTGATMSHPRVLIDVGAHAQASFIEVFLQVGDAPAWCNPVTILRTGPDVVVDVATVENSGPTSFHTATHELHAGPNAHVTHHAYSWGAVLARSDLSVRFEGEGGEAVLNGLYAPGGTQHVDHHTFVDHAHPRCTSQEFYKGILDGKSRGVFYGKVLIRKDAQKSNASQTNKNLLLSREALADSTPALEINADDVKAQHGSTTGQLDAAAVFYLRARGIELHTARSLLTYAFARDVIGRVRQPALRAYLESQLLARLPNGALVKEVLHEVEA